MYLLLRSILGVLALLGIISYIILYLLLRSMLGVLALLGIISYIILYLLLRSMLGVLALLGIISYSIYCLDRAQNLYGQTHNQLLELSMLY